MPIFFHPQSTFIFPLQIPRLIKELWLDALIKNIEENASHSLFQYFLQYSFRGFLSHLFTQEISRYLQGCRFCNHIDHLHKVIFITSNSFFLFKSQYADLSHFKSKGISVFLTQQKDHALWVCKIISTHSGRIFLSKPCCC